MNQVHAIGCGLPKQDQCGHCVRPFEAGLLVVLTSRGLEIFFVIPMMLLTVLLIEEAHDLVGALVGQALLL